MPGLDGAEHYKMRKSLQGAYSRATLAGRLPELVHICRQSLGRWKEGDVFVASTSFKNHISSQISHLMIGVDCKDYVDELLEYEHRALITQVTGLLPKFMLKTPRMRRYRKRIRELQDAITSSHTPVQHLPGERTRLRGLLDVDAA